MLAIPSEVSQTEKEKYPMVSLICRIFKEMIQMIQIQNLQTNDTNEFTKQKQTCRLRG